MDPWTLNPALGRHVWQFLAFSLLLFAPAWWAGAWLSSAWRRPMRCMAAMNLWVALAFGLAAWHADLPAAWRPLAPIGSHLLLLAAGLALWRAGAWYSGAPDDRMAQALLMGLGGLLLLASGLGLATREGGADAVLLLAALALGAGAWRIARRLRLAGERRQALGWAAAGGGLALAVAVLAGFGWWPGLAVVAPARGVAVASSFVGLLLLHGLNLVAAYRVFDRVLLAMERLSVPHPVTGLHQRGVVEQVLAFEAAQHQRSGQRLAMLALRVDGLAALQARLGGQTVAHVLAELAARLRARLAPSDLMGQTDDGVFLVCLTRTDERRARGRLQTLCAAAAELAAARGPDMGPLALQPGLVMVEPGDDIATVLDVALRRSGHVPVHTPIGSPSVASAHPLADGAPWAGPRALTAHGPQGLA